MVRCTRTRTDQTVPFLSHSHLPVISQEIVFLLSKSYSCLNEVKRCETEISFPVLSCPEVNETEDVWKVTDTWQEISSLRRSNGD